MSVDCSHVREYLVLVKLFCYFIFLLQLLLFSTEPEHMYLPIPPHKQDVTEGQFLSGVLQV